MLKKCLRSIGVKSATAKRWSRFFALRERGRGQKKWKTMGVEGSSGGERKGKRECRELSHPLNFRCQTPLPESVVCSHSALTEFILLLHAIYWHCCIDTVANTKGDNLYVTVNVCVTLHAVCHLLSVYAQDFLWLIHIPISDVDELWKQSRVTTFNHV